ncbi:phytoene desaturase family protein [Evansella tamaricis]|uniref:phytoene desaturase family protein n=1 Tax=Evansella tamaricis TaxID=2069301 RepID=UPI001FEB35BF|nr:NAD(P)-binding protein [Evansella tamaricis]
MKKRKHVIIIGGGLGGLSSAILLQLAGWQSTIIEKNSHLGGKLHQIKFQTHHFDFGPNTITMPEVFQSIPLSAGENPDDYFQFQKLIKHTKNSFSDGAHLYFSSDHKEMREELGRLHGPSGKNFDSYLMEVEKLILLAQNYFLNRTFSSWRDFISLPLMKAMISAKPLQSLDQFHKQYFSDQRIRNAFNRYATYIGSSPYSAPATFGLIGHLEFSDGVYFTKGGNYQIARTRDGATGKKDWCYDSYKRRSSEGLCDG